MIITEFSGLLKKTVKEVIGLTIPNFVYVLLDNEMHTVVMLKL